MKLFIDIGNRRIKWATSGQLETASRRNRYGKEIQEQVVDAAPENLRQNLGRQFEALARPEKIVISSVSGPSACHAVIALCRELWQRQPEMLQAGAQFGPLKNRYHPPHSLGIDRWAALVAADHMREGERVAVVDAGTAITIDFIESDGNFPGGMIFPGIATMIRSLNLSTDQIQVHPAIPADRTKLQITNNTTQCAVANGVVLSVVATIDRAIEMFESEPGSKPGVFVTGGDAGIVEGLSGHEMRVEPALVLVGIRMLERRFSS